MDLTTPKGSRDQNVANAAPASPIGSTTMRLSTTIGCICGKCSLKLDVARPGRVAECGCGDCRQKVTWANSMVKREWKASLLSLNYFAEGHLTEVQGEENLKLYQLRDIPTDNPFGPAPFLTAICCHTVLAVPAKYYNGKLFATFAESCKLECDPVEPSIRYSPDELPASSGLVPPYTGTGPSLGRHIFKYVMPPEAGGVGTEEERAAAGQWVSSANWQEGAGDFENLPGKQGETMAALIERLGLEPEILGLEPDVGYI